MNNVLRLALLLAAVAAVAVLSCLATNRFLLPRRAAATATAAAASPRAAESHEWIHRELDISAAQDQALTAVEERYARRRRELTETIRQANGELAQAIVEDGGYSPRVTAAIEKIHRAQGELQRATLEHVFEMRPTLSPGQYEKLLRATAAALQP